MTEAPDHPAALAHAILASAMDFAIVTTDLAGLVTSWNAGAEALLGWSEAEMSGRPAALFFTREDNEAGRPETEMAVARERGRYEDERWHLRKDGFRLWASGLMMRLEDEHTGELLGYLKILRDRSAQHEADEALRESERQYRRLTEALPGFVYTTDTAGQYLFSNEAYQRYTGRTLAELAGEGWTESLHPDDRFETGRAWQEAVEIGSEFNSIVRFRRHDGQYRTFSCRAVSQHDASGAVVGWIGTCIDMEEQRQAESRLAYEKGLLAAVVDQAPVGISIAAAGGTPPILNDHLRGTLGHDTKGDGPDRYMDYGALHDDGSAYEPGDYPTIRAMETGERIDRERMRYRVGPHGRHPAGSIRRLEISSAPVRNGVDAIIAAVTLVEDVEDALRTAEEMAVLERDRQRNQADLDLALDAGNLGTFSLSLPDRVLTCSARFRLNFGHEPDRPFTYAEKLAAIHPEDRTDAERAVERCIASGEGYDNAFRISWPDGSEHWIHTRGRIVRDGGSAAVALTGVAANVTAEKMQQAALHRLNLELEHAVDCRTAELLSKNEELLAQIAVRQNAEEALRQAQKMEAVGQLTGGVAHDFNNLLTIIKSSVELLSRPNLQEDRRRKYIDAIAQTADRAARLTGQLLAFARRQPLKAELFDVAAQLRASLPILRTTTGSRIEVRSDDIVEAGRVEVDRNQFDTAILNMVVNARDAMPQGGCIAIGTGTADHVPAMRAHAEAPGDYVTVTITDTGSGMDEATAIRIFEPFFTTKEVGRGTGLGLSQVFGFAKQSGGEVAVDSAPGKGTRFTLYLPRAQLRPALESNIEADAPPPVREGQGCVLLVEDNQLVGEFATQLLEDIGFGTVWAPNAQAALDLIEEGPDRYSVVFTDVVMPGMSGIEMAQMLRRTHPSLPVVLTSGYSQVLAQEGTHGFPLLQKPYSAGNVAEVLNRTRRS